MRHLRGGFRFDADVGMDATLAAVVLIALVASLVLIWRVRERAWRDLRDRVLDGYRSDA